MRNLRAIPAVFLFLLLSVWAGALSATPPEPAFLVEEAVAPSCSVLATDQETPSLDPLLQPQEASTCFCVTDPTYCRRYYGRYYVCADEPYCGCEHV